MVTATCPPVSTSPSCFTHRDFRKAVTHASSREDHISQPFSELGVPRVTKLWSSRMKPEWSRQFSEMSLEGILGGFSRETELNRRSIWIFITTDGLT